MNTGLIEGQRPEDYKVGANSPLVYVERNETGDWSSYVPPAENQWSNRGDSMSCVTFSAINSIETQEKFLTGSSPNYSDRFTAKMSNTTKDGNYLWAVADTIRKYGLVLEEDYPSPLSYTFEEYHAEIPEPKLSELIAKGKKWLEKWDIAYEWLPVDEELIKKHLKHVPIQVTIPGHAIEEIKQGNDEFTYFDTYNPYVKNRKGLPNYALKIVLTKKDMAKKFIINEGGKLGLMISQDFGAIVTYADNQAHFEELKDALHFTGSEPVVNLPQ